MTHEQLVEKVARAICDDDHKGGDFGMMGIDAWETPHARDVYIGRARAAIAAIYEAMREPSDDMLEIGRKSLRKPRMHVSHTATDDCVTCNLIYRAMLEASPLKGE